MSRFTDKYGYLNEAAINDYIWDGKGDKKLASVASKFSSKQKGRGPAESPQKPNIRQVPQRQQDFRSRTANPNLHVQQRMPQSFYQDMTQQISNQCGYDTAPYAYQQYSSTEKFAIHPSIQGFVGSFADTYVDLYGNKPVEYDGSKRNQELSQQNALAIKRIQTKNNKSLPATVREWAVINKGNLSESVFLGTLMELRLTSNMTEEKFDNKTYDFKTNIVRSCFQD